MTPVIRDALALAIVPDSDVRAIAAYFTDIDQAGRACISGVDATVREALTTSDLAVGQPYDADADLYASACMSCHYNAGRAPLPARPELALNSALTLPEPDQFHSGCVERCRQYGRCAGIGDARLRVAYRQRNRQARRLSAPPPATNVHPGATWKKRSPLSAGSRRHPLNSNREQERYDHDHIRSQWACCFRPQSRMTRRLLWVIRDELGLTELNSVAALALCGACTVHVEGRGHAIPVSLR